MRLDFSIRVMNSYYVPLWTLDYDGSKGCALGGLTLGCGGRV